MPPLSKYGEATAWSDLVCWRDASRCSARGRCFRFKGAHKLRPVCWCDFCWRDASPCSVRGVIAVIIAPTNRRRDGRPRQALARPRGWVTAGPHQRAASCLSVRGCAHRVAACTNWVVRAVSVQLGHIVITCNIMLCCAIFCIAWTNWVVRVVSAQTDSRSSDSTRSIRARRKICGEIGFVLVKLF